MQIFQKSYTTPRRVPGLGTAPHNPRRRPEIYIQSGTSKLTGGFMAVAAGILMIQRLIWA